MKKKISFFISMLMVINMGAVNVFAYNYEFESGANTKETFGVSTPTDTPASNPELENTRRNKDAADLPPSYGIFSGEIPTDPSSLYHSNVESAYASDVTNYSSSSGSTGVLESTSTMTANTVNTISQVSISQPSSSSSLLTQAYLYEDGSIGTIKILTLDISVKVYEGETLENMQKGVGHFEFTSVWDGNVGVAGHNRGSSAYLSGIWNLEDGDEIIYTTKYGRRVYEVFSVQKISDTDYSKLGWSNENMITLITCAANESTMRWAVQAVEKQ